MSSTSYAPRESAPPAEPAGGSRSNGTWLWTLTVICFLFGGVLALQMKAQLDVQHRREVNAQQPIAMQAALQNVTRQLNNERAARTALQSKLNDTQNKLAKAGASTLAASKQREAQTRDLQMIAGLAPVQGPGVAVVLKDNPNAAKDAGDTAFLPGIVHDYDLQQIVNELRNLGAEAIAINGRRVNGFSPIRCVGAPIFVNNEPVSSPFRIEAIGDTATMKSGLTMPGGIIDKLSQILPIRVVSVSSLSLAAGEAPKMRHSKALAP